MIWWIIGGAVLVVALMCVGVGLWLTYKSSMEASE